MWSRVLELVLLDFTSGTDANDKSLLGDYHYRSHGLLRSSRVCGMIK